MASRGVAQETHALEAVGGAGGVRWRLRDGWGLFGGGVGLRKLEWGLRGGGVRKLEGNIVFAGYGAGIVCWRGVAVLRVWHGYGGVDAVDGSVTDDRLVGFGGGSGGNGEGIGGRRGIERVGVVVPSSKPFDNGCGLR